MRSAAGSVVPRHLAIVAVLSTLIGAAFGQATDSGERLFSGPSALPGASAAQLGVRFGAAGVTVRSRSATLTLRLAAAGYGRSMHALAAVLPHASGGRVNYAHRGIDEWYASGHGGIEQGFTITRPARSESSAELALSIEVSGNVTAALDPSGQAVRLRHGATSFRYGKLTAADATGRVLPSSLAMHARRIVLRVDAAHARYPLVIDPLIQDSPKLEGAAGSVEAKFGTSVALSADGATAVIGSPGGNSTYGSAVVLTHTSSAWLPQLPELTGDLTEVVPGESEGGEVEQCVEESGEEPGECAFGRSVAVSADGTTALVGDPSGSTVPGAAWIFTRVGSSWTPSAILTGANTIGEARFGKSVALSADGNTALIGDPSAAAQHGAAWVFTRSGSTWTRGAQPLSPPDGSRLAHFGRSVALSADGDTALIGMPADGGYVGAAAAFSRSGSAWTAQPGKLVGAGELGAAHFGQSVALSGDGTTALIGGPSDDGGQGAVWAFTSSGSSFSTFGQKLTDERGEGGAFGAALALSDDGRTALIGAPRDEANLGAVMTFARPESSWTELPEQLAGTDASGRGRAGASVALSAEGRAAVIGAPRDNGGVGAAWMFADEPASAIPPPSVSNVAPAHGPAAGGTEVLISGANFTGATAVGFGTVAATSFRVKSAAAIEAVAPAEPAGVIDVTVTTPTGTSAATTDAQFRFTSPGSSAQPVTQASPQGLAPSGEAGSTGTLGFGPVTGGSTACSVSLLSRSVSVLHSKAAFKLRKIGAGVCRGRLTLSYSAKAAGNRLRSTSIGTAAFSISSSRNWLILVPLSRSARHLLARRHGTLSASLSILRLLPAPRQLRTSSVRLQTPRPRRTRATPSAAG